MSYAGGRTDGRADLVEEIEGEVAAVLLRVQHLLLVYGEESADVRVDTELK